VIVIVAATAALAVLGYRYIGARVLGLMIAAFAIVFYNPIQDLVADVTRETDSTVVESMVVNFNLSDDGTLAATEKITTRFTEERRGIFRFLDPVDSTDASVTHDVSVISVERCPADDRCVPEPYETYVEDGQYVAKIGDPDVSYPAGTVQTYRISYTQDDAIISADDDGSARWLWDVIGTGWVMAMESVRLSATLPAPPSQAVDCVVGDEQCQVAVEGTRIRQQVGYLAPGTPVTWQVTMPSEGLAVTEVSVPFWRTPATMVVGVGLGAIGLLVLWSVLSGMRERKPDDAPRFDVPGPDLLTLAWTRKEEPPEDSLQAMLLYLRDLGVLHIEIDPTTMYSDEPEWMELERQSVAVPAALTGGEALLNDLGLANPGARLHMSRDSTSVGKLLGSAESSLQSGVRAAAIRQGLATRSAKGTLLHLLALALLPLSMVALWLTASPALAAALAIPAAASLRSDRSLGTTLTASGLKARDSVEGLRTALSTPSSVERYDYSLRVRYFMQYLPWAVALDCADSWARACQPPAGYEQDPAMRTMWIGYHTSRALSTTVRSVSAGAVASYAASQRSSSSGGGFSGGGGSGGGGGGSW